MGVGQRRLSAKALPWLLLGALIIVGAGVAAARLDRDARPPEVQGVFEEPASFCGAVAAQSFTERVENVEVAVRKRQAPHAAVTLTVALLHRTADLGDAPPDLRPRIRNLASHLEAGGEADLRTAQSTASALDQAARMHCE